MHNRRTIQGVKMKKNSFWKDFFTLVSLGCAVSIWVKILTGKWD